MVRKVLLVFLMLGIFPLVVPSRASAHHDILFLPQSVPFQCFTVTRLQPVSQFVLSTNGVFVQVVKTEPVQHVQCVPVQIVQPVHVKKIFIVKQNGNGHFRHNGNGHGNGFFRHNGNWYGNGHFWQNGSGYGNGYFMHRNNGYFWKFQPARFIVIRQHNQYEDDDDD